MFKVDPSSPVPPFEQLRASIRAAVQSGALAPETRMPTVRSLAADLQLAPGTVARAYRELEAAGLLETRGRAGTFVSVHGDAVQRAAQKSAAEYAAEVRRLGVGRDEALEYVRAAL